MSSPNAAVKILECFVLCCALLAVSTQGQLLQRIHRHRHGVEVKNLMDPEMERGAPIRFHDDMPSHRFRGRHSRHHGADEDTGFDEETRNLRLLERQEAHLEKLPSSIRGSHAIRKRHNGPSDNVAYATITDANRAKLVQSRVRGMIRRGSLDTVRNEPFEVEVKEAQNSSLCNYTVVDIPDTSNDKSRTPKNLVNVICNHAGSRCRHAGTYCCIQTYSKIDVSYRNGVSENIKIYTGCVCSLQMIAGPKENTLKPRISD